VLVACIDALTEAGPIPVPEREGCVSGFLTVDKSQSADHCAALREHAERRHTKVVGHRVL